MAEMKIPKSFKSYWEEPLCSSDVIYESLICLLLWTSSFKKVNEDVLPSSSELLCIIPPLFTNDSYKKLQCLNFTYFTFPKYFFFHQCTDYNKP